MSRKVHSIFCRTSCAKVFYDPKRNQLMVCSGVALRWIFYSKWHVGSLLSTFSSSNRPPRLKFVICFCSFPLQNLHANWLLLRITQSNSDDGLNCAIIHVSSVLLRAKMSSILLSLNACQMDVFWFTRGLKTRWVRHFLSSVLDSVLQYSVRNLR